MFPFCEKDNLKSYGLYLSIKVMQFINLQALVMDLQGKKAKHINIQISKSNDGCNLGTYRFWLFWRNESCTVPVSLLPLKNLVRTTLKLSA
jgi:hypothetical protein